VLSIFKKQGKNNKLLYYLKAFTRLVLPSAYFRSRLQDILNNANESEKAYIHNRVNYYNKLSTAKPLSATAIPLGNIKLPKVQKVYYFDLQEYIRYFNNKLRIHFLPGDIVHVPDEPTLLKSRPVKGNNENSVLQKLNKVRHFMFVNDTKPFSEKKNMLVGRGVIKVPHRVRFFEQYFDHPLCDLGQINSEKNQHWIKPAITIAQHLDYKFILCLEGYDVASNLKWVMSSNSLAVMPEPTYESWFMEGRLVAGYHYVKIKDDYSDLKEQLQYYIDHPDQAEEIARNANAYVAQFRNKKREDLISLLVLEKYFLKTSQEV
jgi:hypothetical protein